MQEHQKRWWKNKTKVTCTRPAYELLCLAAKATNKNQAELVDAAINAKYKQYKPAA